MYILYIYIYIYSIYVCAWFLSVSKILPATPDLYDRQPEWCATTVTTEASHIDWLTHKHKSTCTTQHSWSFTLDTELNHWRHIINHYRMFSVQGLVWYIDDKLHVILSDRLLCLETELRERERERKIKNKLFGEDMLHCAVRRKLFLLILFSESECYWIQSTGFVPDPNKPAT